MDETRNAVSLSRDTTRLNGWPPRGKTMLVWVRALMDFTPINSSRLSMLGRFFRDLTTQNIRRGTFRSVDELV